MHIKGQVIFANLLDFFGILPIPVIYVFQNYMVIGELPDLGARLY